MELWFKFILIVSRLRYESVIIFRYIFPEENDLNKPVACSCVVQKSALQFVTA
jgi:hypothetical protein